MKTYICSAIVSINAESKKEAQDLFFEELFVYQNLDSFSIEEEKEEIDADSRYGRE